MGVCVYVRKEHVWILAFVCSCWFSLTTSSQRMQYKSIHTNLYVYDELKLYKAKLHAENRLPAIHIHIHYSFSSHHLAVDKCVAQRILMGKHVLCRKTFHRLVK